MNRNGQLSASLSTIADGEPFVLANATFAAACLGNEYSDLPQAGDGIVRADLLVMDGKIAGFSAPHMLKPEARIIDLDRDMVWPCFVDCHAHLDKGHIWSRSANPDGSFSQALAAAYQDGLAHWTLDDIRARTDFAIRQSLAHGTRAIRTHIDIESGRMEQTQELIEDIRDRWSDRIDLQFASLHGLELFDTEGFVERVAQMMVGIKGGVLGAFLYDMPDLDHRLERFFRLADEFGLDVDLHADENTDPTSRTLLAAARAILKTGYSGRVLAGHACALSVRPAEELARELDIIQQAGIAIVSLPLCNLYLQDRATGITPRLRGVAPVQECRASGIDVAFASDNVRDPFHAYGEMDMFDVFRSAVKIQHLDHPIGAWPASVNADPARMCGFQRGANLSAGEPADLIIFNARNFSELLARPQTDRIILERGMLLAAMQPDFRELDHLKGMLP